MQDENKKIPESVLQGLLGNFGDGVILTDRLENVTYINPAALKILGYNGNLSGDVKFMTVCPLVRFTTGTAFQSPLRQVLSEKCSVGFPRNAGIYHPNTKVPVYLSATCSPLQGDDGHVVGCMVLVRDVTRFRRMEMNLEADRVYMRAVFSAARVGLCVLGDHGEIIDINEAGIEVMDASYEVLLGKQLGDVLCCENSLSHGCGKGPECKHCIVRDNINRSLSIEGYSNAVTTQLYSTKSAEPIWLHLVFSQILTERGKQIIVAILNVSHRKKREDALEEAIQRAEAASMTKSQFLANMSHEIRTPINGMNGMIDLTLRTTLNEEQRENLISAKQCSEDLLRIINDILDFSKLECGKMQLESIDYDLHKALQRVVDIHKKVARGKRLTFTEPDLSTVPKYITGDPTRLRQILHNLLTNAIKFTSEGGVTVKVAKDYRQEDPILTFSVQDTGIGMTAEEQTKLFRPFSQVDGSITRKFGGTGLGLMIVKDLLAAMGGDVQVRSVPLRGSEFSFWIPLHEAQGESEASNERTVYINPKYEELKNKKKKAEPSPDEFEDISNLLAYCELKMDE